MISRIDEQGGVNYRLTQLTNEIANRILNDSTNKKRTMSSVRNVSFVEGNFDLTNIDFLEKGYVLHVKYTMYYTNNENMYQYLWENGIDGSSEFDENKQMITIVSGFVNDKVHEEFYGTIEHELEHLFKYSVGIEQREDLLNKAYILCDEDNETMNNVGICCYYSFKEEQDAFKQEFYRYLMQNKPKTNKETAIENFMYYTTVRNAYEIIKQKDKNDEDLLSAIHYLGYNRGDFMKLISYRIKRFHRKLCQAYERYLKDTFKPRNEMAIRRHTNRIASIITESIKCGYEVKTGMESFYIF